MRRLFSLLASTIAVAGLAACDAVTLNELKPGVSTGYEVPPHYDSLLCKLITRGDTREQACARMLAALESLVCEGVPTTVPVHLAILRSAAFQAGRYDTRSIPGWPPA